MARKSGYISVLQFDAHRITWLRARRSPKGVDVAEAASVSGNWVASDSDFVTALQSFVREHNIADDGVFTVLPRHEMTARILVLPSQSEDELANMLTLSIEEYVPFSPREVINDQCILQKLPDGQSSVLAVFAHRDVVESHMKALRACGIEPEQILVSTACLAAAVAQVPLDADERIALLHLGSNGIEVLIVHGNRVEYGRGVALVHDWEHADAAAIDELASELRTSISAYRRESEDDSTVDRVSVCSDWADVEPLADSLSEATGYSCAPTGLLQAVCTNGANQLKATPLVAIGASLSAQERAPFTISLVPDSLKQSRGRRALKQEIVKYGGLIGVILLLLIGLYVQATWQRGSYIQELQSRINAIKPLAESIKLKEKQLAVLQQSVESRGSALELLAELVKRAPSPGVNILRFSYVHGESLTVTGRAETINLVDQWIDNLREAGKTDVPEFARVHSGRHDQEVEFGSQVIQFEILIPLGEEEAAPATPAEPASAE